MQPSGLNVSLSRNAESVVAFACIAATRIGRLKGFFSAAARLGTWPRLFSNWLSVKVGNSRKGGEVDS